MEFVDRWLKYRKPLFFKEAFSKVLTADFYYWRSSVLTCLAPVSLKARFTEAGDVVYGLLASSSAAWCCVTLGCKEKVQYLNLYHFSNSNAAQKRSVLRTFITSSKFSLVAFLIVPLPSVSPCVDVDLHAELCAVVVVGLVLCPRLLTNPCAVVPNPGPSFVHVGFGDSDPIIWTSSSVWQHGDQIIILLLVLDHHQVCVMSQAILSSLRPVHGFRWVMISPAQSRHSQGAT